MQLTQLNTKAVFFLALALHCFGSFAQTYSSTGSGTIGSNCSPTGWSSIASPDYSSTTTNGFHSSTPWSTTLPASPSGDTTFPVFRSTNPAEGIGQTITGLIAGATYTFTVHYMYPTATGTYGTNFNRPMYQCAYACFDSGALQYMDTFGYFAPTNTWLTQTFSVVSTGTTMLFQLGITSANNYRAAVAYSFNSMTSSTFLPVDLTSFSAHKKNHQTTNLIWITASETNNNGFTIQRSAENQQWVDIGYTEGQNRNSTTTYQFTDFYPLAGPNYYRLKQMDIDGASSFSETQIVEFDNTINKLSIYPNPAKSSININLPTAQSVQTIQILSADGKTILEKNVFSSTSLDIRSLRAGFYTIRMHSSNQLLLTEKLLIKK